MALKPRRRITRRELKKDPLLETIYSLQKFYERNRGAVRIVVLGGAFLFVANLMVSGWRSSTTQSAAEIFARGLSRFSTGEIVGARDDFEVLIDEYGGTQSGRDALFYLGRIHLESGDTPAAERSFRHYLRKGKSVFLKAAVLENLGNMAWSEGNYEEAAGFFLQASSLSTFPFNRQQNKLYAAECWLKAGNIEKARRLLTELESIDNVHRVIQDQIDEFSGQLRVIAH